jgi:hypothetical protein
MPNRRLTETDRRRIAAAACGFLGPRQSLPGRILVCNEPSRREARHLQTSRRQSPNNSWYVLGVSSTVTTRSDGAAPREAVRRGRRSMSERGDSPQIRVRVPAHLRELAEDRARRENTTVSEIAREALERALRPQRREERVQLELHRALLSKLISDYDGVRELAMRNLAKSRKVVRGDQALGWLDEWQALLDGPPGRLVDVLLSTDEHSIDLRQVSPFAGALSDDERLAAIDRAGSHATR